MSNGRINVALAQGRGMLFDAACRSLGMTAREFVQDTAARGESVAERIDEMTARGELGDWDESVSDGRDAGGSMAPSVETSVATNPPMPTTPGVYYCECRSLCDADAKHTGIYLDHHDRKWLHDEGHRLVRLGNDMLGASRLPCDASQEQGS